MEIDETTIETTVSQGKKKRITIVISALMGFAVLLCIVVIAQVLSKGYVSIGGYSLFRVVTGSMEPTMQVGTMLIAEDTPIEEIQPGEIVTFRSREPGMFRVIITHRVLSVQTGSNGKRYLETKGDANPYADANYVDEDYLIGRVVWYTGENNVFAQIMKVVTGKTGFLACIVLPCILSGLFVMKDCIKNMREEMDAINQELDRNGQTAANDLQQQMNEEDYNALRERLRNELLEELKQSAEPETTEQEPGTGQE